MTKPGRVTERGVTANRGASLEPIALIREHGGVVRVVDGPVGIDIRFNPSANPLNTAFRARTATRVAVARDREYDLLHPALGLHVATAAAVNLERLAA